MKHPSNRILGIMVCYDPNKSYFKKNNFFYRLAVAANLYDIEAVIFDPIKIDWAKRTIPCLALDAEGKSFQKESPMPALIYDRCNYLGAKNAGLYARNIFRLQIDRSIRVLGYGLKGKWTVSKILAQSPFLAPYLPITYPYQTPKGVLGFLAKYRNVLLKPSSGSHGKGVLVINYLRDRFEVSGRSLMNTDFNHSFFDSLTLVNWLNKFLGKRIYILQQFLRLKTFDNRPFDLRTLIQKNGNRDWSVTGRAIRLGPINSVTSNLHGGGSAAFVHPFLEKTYSPKIANRILQDIFNIEKTLPSFLEKNYAPLLELGIDIGIDQQGKVWILEVNSKPGRAVFKRMGDKQTYKQSIQMPVDYANSFLT